VTYLGKNFKRFRLCEHITKPFWGIPKVEEQGWGEEEDWGEEEEWSEEEGAEEEEW